MNEEPTDMRGEEMIQKFDVGNFAQKDAPGIVRLFRSVYGEGYPIKLFYDEEALKEANAEGRYQSIVARTLEGDVIGVEHLFHSAPHEAVYEAGAGLVHRDFRKMGINTLMLAFLFNEWVPSKPHIEMIFGESVCNHPHMQKTLNRFGLIDMALEVCLMPAEAYSKEKSATGRVAALLQFRAFRQVSRQVFLPLPYEEELRLLYGRLGGSRELMPREGRVHDDLPSDAEVKYFDFAQLCRVSVKHGGTDFGDYMAAIEKETAQQKVKVVQVWLPLSCAWAGAATDKLRKRGYFFGGLLPRWFDGDGLLMQKIHCPPDFDTISLHAESAEIILEMVKKDWQRSRREE
jgi:hypothetical protein